MKNLIEGIVIESSEGVAKVRCSRHSDCENCGTCPGDSAMIIDVVDDIGREVGQQVLVESKETNMLLAAFLIYIFPLLAVGGGILLGKYLASKFMASDTLMMTLGGILFGLAALYIVKRLDKSLQSEKPIIVKNIK